MNAVKKYCSAVLIGAVISFLFMLWRGFFSNGDTVRAYKILCDAFFVPSVLLLGTGLLSFAKARGFFDGLSYSFDKFRASFSKKESRVKGLKGLYEYGIMKKEEGKRETKLYLIFTGLLFLAVAFMFQYLYSGSTL